jgi:hypothetical protein
MHVACLAFDVAQPLFDYSPHHLRIAFGAKIED